MDYIQEAKNLVKNLDQRMGPSAYDTAWMARVKSPDGGPRWPELIEWLLENQRLDGSWGGEIEYYHDRIICTLISIIALYENRNYVEVQDSITRGESYIWQHLHLLPRDPYELVGFELILPTLLGEAQQLGLDVPTHTCGYEKIQTEKLSLIPPHLLYSPKITSVHSLEFLGQKPNRTKLKNAQGSNGSLGNSPSTTAYYLSLFPSDQNALEYLEKTINHSQYPSVLYPFETFELTWVLNNLIFSGVPITKFASTQIWEKLSSQISINGIGLDPTFGITDGDITAVSSRLLSMAGYEVDPNILARFEDSNKHIFRTYNYERNASVSTNIHAFEAVRVLGNYPNLQQIREQIIVMLLSKRRYNTYWVDKWHASPYYASSHAIAALLEEGTYLANVCKYTIDWMIHTQHNDGAWGFFGQGTAEETAYVLIALLHYHQHVPIKPDILHRGTDYLYNSHQRNEDNYHPLWIDKCLYTPYNIVHSAVLAALILYSSTF